MGLALLKVRRFLDGGLRLRTACDFKPVGEMTVTEPEGFSMPNEGPLMEVVQQKIKAAKDLFAKPPITEIGTNVVLKGGDKAEE